LEGNNYKALYIVGKVDGSPLFFPVDGDTFTPASELKGAQIPPVYDASATWPYDLDATGAKRQHNFSFTSELHSYFRYDKSKPLTLDFVGDDDLWIFINGRLAVDLGGIHPAVDGRIIIGTDGNAVTTITATYPTSPAPTPTKQTLALALQDGVVYEIAIFQAERQSTSSSLKLTLPPFNNSPSECSF
jgi:fibro-slime domain-containing protein